MPVDAIPVGVEDPKDCLRDPQDVARRQEGEELAPALAPQRRPAAHGEAKTAHVAPVTMLDPRVPAEVVHESKRVVGAASVECDLELSRER